MRRSPVTWARAWAPGAAAVATLAGVVWRLGTGPFVDGVRAADARLLAAAAALGLATTVSCAWRWRIVARALGAELTLPAAVAAYYRSLFLNLTLPGGVAGDVHRAIAHGRDANDVRRAVRAVVWERGAGQVVQLLVTFGVLLTMPSPVRGDAPLAAVVAAAAAGAVVLAVRVRPAVAADLHAIRRMPGAVAAIAATSAVAVLGHAAAFLLAARTAGSTASASQMLPLALLAMLAMALPSVAGWGPREGATAWIFAAAGLGADRGAETAVVYGVMAVAAALPGAGVLVWASLPRPRSPQPQTEGASHG